MGREFSKGGFPKHEYNRTDLNKATFNRGVANRQDPNSAGFFKKDFNKGIENGSTSTPRPSNSTISMGPSENRPVERKRDQSNVRTREYAQSTIPKDKMEVGNTYKVCFFCIN